MRHAEFADPRLVEVYDAECPWSRDDDFFVSIVDETPGVRVLDLGCGTGRLALGMAKRGHAVTGIDPARASLAAARAKPGADAVRWIEGTSAQVTDGAFDVAVMTSHVAQFFVTDLDWSSALGDLGRSLVPGGTLVFDTRDPRARAWEGWNQVDSRRLVTLRRGDVVTIWTEVTGVEDGTISFTHHYRFADGDEMSSEAMLRFRSGDEVRSSLHDAGFDIEHIYGGWKREPVGEGDGELIVVARSRRTPR